MRKFMLALCLVLATGAFSACSKKEEHKTIVKATLAATPEPTFDNSTPEPSGTTIWSLTTNHYYVFGNKMYEKACDIKDNYLLSNNKKLGSVGKKGVTITYNDLYYDKRVSLNWKMADSVLTLDSNDWVYKKYRKLWVHNNMLYNTTYWYEVKDDTLYYKDIDGKSYNTGVSVSVGSTGTWSFTNTDESNWVSKKDSKDNVYYTEELIRSVG